MSGSLGIEIEWKDTYVFMLGLIYMFATDSWPVSCSRFDVNLFEGTCHVKAETYQTDTMTLELEECTLNMVEMDYYPPWV